MILFVEEDWDYLMILDACRYDYFKKVYRNFFDGGKLKKEKSTSTFTNKWLVTQFKKNHNDIIYVSANPHINSKTSTNYAGQVFDAKKHFFKVVDVWDKKWNDELRSVQPKDVNKEALKVIKKYPKKRFIIHYMQPHQPYIGKKYRKYSRNAVRQKKEGKEKIAGKIGRFYFLRKINIRIIWMIAKIFNIKMRPASMIGMEEGFEGLKKAYMENLRLVLKHVSELVENLDGKIVVSSDHGECLGENGYFGHGYVISEQPVLKEIPYFIHES